MCEEHDEDLLDLGLQECFLFWSSWNENVTIYAISSDFGHRMTTQHLD